MAIKEEIRMNNFTVKFFEAKKGYSATKEYEHYNCECAQSVTEDDLAQVIFMTVRPYCRGNGFRHSKDS